MFNNLGQWLPDQMPQQNQFQQSPQPQMQHQMQPQMPQQMPQYGMPQMMQPQMPQIMNKQMQAPQEQMQAPYSPQFGANAWYAQNPQQNAQSWQPNPDQNEQQAAQSPQNMQQYLQFMQQSNAGGNNAMFNQHQMMPQNQQGYQGGFTGGMQNNFQQIPSAMQAGQQQNAMMTYSDKNSKENIKGGDVELSSFLDSLGIYSYEYKDKKDGEGRRISPMAQEIIKSPLGAVAVSKDERGLMRVDYAKLMGTMLSGIAMHHQELKELNEKINSAMDKRIK